MAAETGGMVILSAVDATIQIAQGELRCQFRFPVFPAAV